VHVAVWDLRNGTVVRRWDWPKGDDPHSDIECICFRRDGKQLAAAVFRQSMAYLWDLTTGDQIAQLPHDHLYGLSFSPDNETLATAGWDKIVRFWKTSSGEMRREINISTGLADGDHRMYTVCYATAGGLLATAHLDGMVRIWNATDMELRKEFKVNGRFIYGAIAFSPDGSLLATGSMAGEIALWDPLAAEVMWKVGQHESYVYTVGFGADNRTLVSGGQDSVCYRWDLQPRGEQPDQDLNVLWKDLGGEGSAAYRAMWAMTRIPDRTVAFLGNKLRPVTKVMDLDRIVKGLPADEAARRERLVRILADKDEKVALSTVARRATVTLGQLGTPDAIRLLKELAERDPNSDLGKLAAAAVERSIRSTTSK
jgi:WD40 repeat protein